MIDTPESLVRACRLAERARLIRTGFQAFVRATLAAVGLLALTELTRLGLGAGLTASLLAAACLWPLHARLCGVIGGRRPDFWQAAPYLLILFGAPLALAALDPVHALWLDQASWLALLAMALLMCERLDASIRAGVRASLRLTYLMSDALIEQHNIRGSIEASLRAALARDGASEEAAYIRAAIARFRNEPTDTRSALAMARAIVLANPLDAQD
ncbi:hypothetical protein J2T57_001705 [Natronocella acetinitrilica]|uniref:Uncharacterized protein n=1 Tax=Natronocella acetinitrilica TaxID=414046 RepID=A0AAE3G3P4_9GAMM|nr:hypothetical protein [Natronocella acetinitrilica]MCP1674603.1 hypothetical protein [Natronocella acetinitrilica]